MTHLKEPPLALHPPEPAKYTAVIKVVTQEPATPVRRPPSFCRTLCRACSLCTLGLLVSLLVATVWAILTTPANNGRDLVLPENNGPGSDCLDEQGLPEQALFDPLNDWTLAFTYQGAAIDSDPVDWCNDSGRAMRDASASGDAFITYRSVGITSFRIQTFLIVSDGATAPSQSNASLPFVPFTFMVGDSRDNWQTIPVNYKKLEDLPVGERGMFSPQEPVVGMDLLRVVLHDLSQEAMRAQVGDVLIVADN